MWQALRLKRNRTGLVIQFLRANKPRAYKSILAREGGSNKMRLNKKGFTLVEIMIVVAIIVLLAAIAIPNLLRARLSANEATAIAAMRTLSTAMESYRAAQSPPAYPDNIAILGSVVSASVSLPD